MTLTYLILSIIPSHGVYFLLPDTLKHLQDLGRILEMRGKAIDDMITPINKRLSYHRLKHVHLGVCR